MSEAKKASGLGDPLAEDVLKLWYDFMKASDRSKWNADMRKHLGPKPDERYDDWRIRCREDMVILTNWYLEVHEDLDAFKHWYVPKEDFDLNEIHLTVNLDNPKLELKKAFSKLLDEVHTTGRGRPKEPVARAFFHPNSEVNVKALRKTLGVHVAYHENPRVTAIEVARDVLGMQPEKLDGVGRRSAQAEVGRQRRKAKEILRGVEHGEFPVPPKRRAL